VQVAELRRAADLLAPRRPLDVAASRRKRLEDRIEALHVASGPPIIMQ
jgi:hypothetical protein